jgi:hypothetical protein
LPTTKDIKAGDVRHVKSTLTQLIDVLQQDISGSTTRKKYQHFITGGVGPGITSSLFQTVYDQDFTLQTANAVFDVTVGLSPAGNIVSSSISSTDAYGKELFPSQSVMMREKMDTYRQFAQMLLGDATANFSSPYASTTAANQIDAALFVSFKRLFSRDSIKMGTFAMQFYPTASLTSGVDTLFATTAAPNYSLLSDTNAVTNQQISTNGGMVGNIVNSANIGSNVGLLFYDAGIAILDLAKVTSASQHVTGTIHSMNNAGQQIFSASFIPNLLVSASVDDIVDHICYTRFSSGSLSAATFQNVTNINSTIIYCRLGPDEFNYSSNPTFTDSTGKLKVIEDDDVNNIQTSFTYITTVGLYDGYNNLLAVAKLSRPLEKSIERDLTLRVRLDF